VFSALEDLPVLSYGRFSPLLIFFYLLLILGLYVVHWIGLSLSFSKSPSLLKTESGCKSYNRFHLPIFFSWCKSGGAGLYTVRSGVRIGAAPKPVQNTFLAQVRRSLGCAPGGPAQSPVRPTFDRFWPSFAPNGPISICYKRGFFPNGFLGFLVCS
jgi:hypothetical protein